MGEPVDYPNGVEPARAAVRAERRYHELTPTARAKEVSATGLPDELPHIRVSADDSPTTIDVAELLRYRELLWTLADRDLRVRYKQTALGVIWVVLQPLLASLIFAFVFGVLAGLPSNGRPYVLFAFAGMIAWTTFSNILSRTTLALTGNSQILSRIYFPRLILPLSSAAASLVDMAVSLCLMLVMLLIYRVWPGWGILLLPIWLVILVTLSLGLGLITGSLIVRYRDIGHIIPVVLQLGLFITPVAWSTWTVPGRYRWVFQVNPLTGILEAFRWSLLGEGTLSLSALAYSVTAAIAIFWFGAVVFKRQERSFADVI
jgi:lipopolysaccharide transport system permease protein